MWEYVSRCMNATAIDETNMAVCYYTKADPSLPLRRDRHGAVSKVVLFMTFKRK